MTRTQTRPAQPSDRGTYEVGVFLVFVLLALLLIWAPAVIASFFFE